MAGLRVLLIPGSARTGSWNLQLAQAAAAVLRELGAEPSVADLRALALPVYDADLEAAQGVPAGAGTLARQMAGHDAFVVVSPEYNAFPTPLLINTIDWV
jgi:NAD(P)H-dependent FMN reductase